MADPSPFYEALIGKPISHVWRGYGSAIFIEFGELTPGKKRKNNIIGNPDGEITLMLESSWRVERKKSILGGSWSAEKKWKGFLQKLHSETVISVETFGYIPEIIVSLSNGLRIVSFNTYEGQPDWAILTRNPSIGSLCVERGALKIEQKNPNKALQHAPSALDSL